MKVVNKLMRPGPRAWRSRGIARGLLIGLVLLPFVIPVAAQADDSVEQAAQKMYWQTKYRDLLARAVELRATVDTEKELYADANRRNYRRGTKRHVHHDLMNDAAAELKEVESELATIEEEGRRAGAMPGWFYEVELEHQDTEPSPAIADEPGDEGRNPIYRKERKSDN